MPDPFDFDEVLDRPSANQASKKCPHCAELIQPDARKCKHCGEWLNDPGPKKDTGAKSIARGIKRYEADKAAAVALGFVALVAAFAIGFWADSFPLALFIFFGAMFCISIWYNSR